MKIVIVDVTIQGTTPLLCHAFADKDAIQASSGTSSAAAAADRGTPREQCEACLYRGAGGKPGIPQPNLFRCIIDGGAGFKSGKNKITTQKSSIIPSCVEIDGLEFPIIHKEPWDVDSRGVVIPSTGGRIFRHRPRFNDWSLSFTMRVDVSILGIKLMREIVDASGKRVGLGDFRPARKGPFGKFVVVQWKERQAVIAA